MRRVIHRDHHVEVLGHLGDVLRGVIGPGRSLAERRGPQRTAERADLGLGLLQETHDRVLRIAPEPREAHARQLAVRAPDVVVDDVVEAGLHRLDRDRLVVGPHIGVGEVGEPGLAVAVEVLRAVRVLDEPVLVTVGLRVGGQLGVVERDDAPDHANAQRVQLPGDLPRVVVGRGRTGLLRDRHLGRVVDDPFLVLDVELHRVDAVLTDHREDRLAQRGVGPGGPGHVHGADVLRVGRGHRHEPGRLVAGRVGRDDLGARRRRLVADRERRAGEFQHTAGGDHGGALFDGARDRDRVLDRHGLGRRRHRQGRRGGVDGEAPRRRGRAAREAAIDLGHDRVPALRQPSQARGQGAGAAGGHLLAVDEQAGVIATRLQRHRCSRQGGRVEGGLGEAVERDATLGERWHGDPDGAGGNREDDEGDEDSWAEQVGHDREFPSRQGRRMGKTGRRRCGEAGGAGLCSKATGHGRVGERPSWGRRSQHRHVAARQPPSRVRRAARPPPVRAPPRRACRRRSTRRACTPTSWASYRC